MTLTIPELSFVVLIGVSGSGKSTFARGLLSVPPTHIFSPMTCKLTAIIEQDKDGEMYVLQRNEGKRIIPLVFFEDDSFLVEPTNAELARKLGLKTEAKKTYYDLIIIGGGPAGLTAAIYAAREGADVLLIERSGLGGQASITVGLDNFPGFPEGISGQEFSERVTQ